MRYVKRAFLTKYCVDMIEANHDRVGLKLPELTITDSDRLLLLLLKLTGQSLSCSKLFPSLQIFTIPSENPLFSFVSRPTLTMKNCGNQPRNIESGQDWLWCNNDEVLIPRNHCIQSLFMQHGLQSVLLQASAYLNSTFKHSLSLGALTQGW